MDIRYQIIRSSRKTIAIQIKPSGEVLIRCPRRMPIYQIEAFLDSKRSWVEKHLSKLPVCVENPFIKSEIDQLRTRTKELLDARVRYYLPILGVQVNQISVRAQKTRWGSCSSKGNLNFNCLLALVPADVLDYVVVHELCHLKHMNHSEEFWTEVEKILPDYKVCRLWLKEQGSALINRI